MKKYIRKLLETLQGKVVIREERVCYMNLDTSVNNQSPTVKKISNYVWTCTKEQLYNAHMDFIQNCNNAVSDIVYVQIPAVTKQYSLYLVMVTDSYDLERLRTSSFTRLSELQEAQNVWEKTIPVVFSEVIEQLTGLIGGTFNTVNAVEPVILYIPIENPTIYVNLLEKFLKHFCEQVDCEYTYDVRSQQFVICPKLVPKFTDILNRGE